MAPNVFGRMMGFLLNQGNLTRSRYGYESGRIPTKQFPFYQGKVPGLIKIRQDDDDEFGMSDVIYPKASSCEFNAATEDSWLDDLQDRPPNFGPVFT